MYNLESAVLRKKGRNQRFQPVDLTEVYLKDLFDQYQDGYIELSNPSLTSHVFVKLEDLKQASNLTYSNAQFPTWLARQGNKTIFGSTVRPKITAVDVVASDASQAGCVIKRVQPNDIAGVNTYSLADMTDVYLTKNISDYTMLQRYALTTVNGLLHINIPRQKGILIKAAGTSLDVENDNHIGLLSFENIGEIHQIVFDPKMLMDKKPNQTYRQAMYLNLNQDLTKKTVLFSFMGRLYGSDDVVVKINDAGAIRINFYKLDVAQLILDSLGKLNLKTLNLDERVYKAGCLKLEDVVDDSVLLAAMQLMQTFFIIVDAQPLYRETIALNYTRLPGIYELTHNTKYPYIDDRGVMYPYWQMTYPGAYTSIHRLHLKQTFYNSPVYRTGGYLPITDTWINNVNQLNPRTEFNSGHLLRLFSETIAYDPDA
ncbi:MAG: hypothetical protein [Bacteriophage sp.]|nr:MAG: hypothetical protein [Bacteriophage sp.]